MSRSQESGVRSQRPDVRGQMSEKSSKFEVTSSKLWNGRILRKKFKIVEAGKPESREAGVMH